MLNKSQRRDLNEPLIIAVYQAIGAHVNQMDKSAGFDLLVTSIIHQVVEVKRSHKAPLTESEKILKAAIERAGGYYHIVVTPFEALEVFGYTVNSLNRRRLLMLVKAVEQVNLDIDIEPMRQEFLDAVISRLELMR